MSKMRAPRVPQKGGPGLLFILVVLVVVGVVAARFLGFVPGANEDPVRNGGTARTERQSGDESDRSGAGRDRPDADVPQVVVYHAHTSENYGPGDSHNKRGAGDVVEVGKAFVTELQAKGIGVIHLTARYDADDYEESFVRALQDVNEVLLANDQIQAVVDLHRDAVPDRPDGYTTATVDGEDVAKVLFVVGDLSNPLRRENLAFAELIRDKMNSSFPGVMRGVKVQHGDYNGKAHPNHLSVFVGDYEDNILEEARRSARLLAGALSEVLTQQTMAVFSPDSLVQPEEQFP